MICIKIQDLIDKNVSEYVIENNIIGSRMVSVEERACLYFLIHKHKPKIIVEFGIQKGQTANFILDSFNFVEQYIGIDLPDGEIPVLDSQKGEKPLVPGDLVKDYNNVKILTPKGGSKNLTINDLPKADFVFIDGDHSYEGVKSDTELAFQILNKNGIIVWHDYNNISSVTNFVDEICNNSKIKHIENTRLCFFKKNEKDKIALCNYDKVLKKGDFICDNIGVVVMTSIKFKERYTACKETWAKDFKHVYFFGGSESKEDGLICLDNVGEDHASCFYKQMLGLKWIYEHFPDLDWYGFRCCDGFFHAENIKTILKNYNPNERFFIGGDLLSFKQRSKLDTNCLFYPSGGAGFFISQSLMKDIYSKIDFYIKEWEEVCDVNFNCGFAGDVAISYFIYKYYNINITKECGFYGFRLINPLSVVKKACSIHYISPEEMNDLYMVIKSNKDTYDKTHYIDMEDVVCVSELVEKNNSKIVVELGINNGRFAHYLLQKCGSIKQYIIINLFDGENFILDIQKEEKYKIPFKLYRKLKILNQKDINESLITDILSNVDFVFIDRNFSCDSIKLCSELLFKILNNNGIIVWNGCGKKDEIAKFINEIDKEKFFTYLDKNAICVFNKNKIDYNKKNIISFSLYGSDKKYTYGAIENVELAKHIYPGWICRFYYNNSVPKEIIDKLKELGAETVDMTSSTFGGMFWRFLVHDDVSVYRYVVRDVDSRVNMREKECVDEWIKSGKKFHIMRDHDQHGANIMGGMYGAISCLDYKIFDIILQDLILSQLWKKKADQTFLKKYIYPIIKDDMLVHDDWDRYGESANKFPCKRIESQFVGKIENPAIKDMKDYNVFFDNSNKSWNIFKKEVYKNKKIFLSTYYFSGNKERDNEINFCVEKNLSNKYIDIVIYFIEEECIDFFNEKFNYFNYLLIPVKKRITINTVFSFIYKYLQNNICIITNTDIFFDNTISFLDKIDFDKRICVVLSRHEFIMNNKEIVVIDRPNMGNTHFSHDVWIYKPFDKIEMSEEVYFGQTNCEGPIHRFMIENGYICKNLYNYINAIHFHCSEIRNQISAKKKSALANIPISDFITDIMKDNIIVNGKIPIFILTCNRIECLKKSINSYLKLYGNIEIVILDNNSTFFKMLEYLKELEKKYKVFYSKKNISDANDFSKIWSGVISKYVEENHCMYYIVTDPDIEIIDGFNTLIECYIYLLEKHPEISVVGPMLEIADIPDYYPLKSEVYYGKCEEVHFWEYEKHYCEKFNTAYVFTHIDTTFGIYKSNFKFKNYNYGIRVYSPFSARHLDWYIDPNEMTEDQIYYTYTAGKITNYSGIFCKKNITKTSIDEYTKKDILSLLGIKYNTDKYYHNYLYIYDYHFNHIREKCKSVLEIGIFKGHSLRMWRDYFINANIYGIDNNIKSLFNEDRITSFFYDQSYVKNLEDFFCKIGYKTMDIIIDDGSHIMRDQQNCFANFFKYVQPGGYYVIEDIHTSFPCYYNKGFQSENGDTTYDFILGLSTGIINTKYIQDVNCKTYILNNIESIFIYEKENKKSATVLIKKKEKNEYKENIIFTNEKKRLVVFYHVCAINDYQDIFNEFIFMLIDSGLYSEIDKIYIGIVGEGILKNIPDKASIIYQDKDILKYEILTLRKLWEYCQDSNGEEYVLYCHTKGVSFRKEDIEHRNYRDVWRLNMLFNVVYNYKKCINYLLYFDVCSAFMLYNEHKKVFLGNFWWTKCSYVKNIENIDDNLINRLITPGSNPRYIAETWITLNEKCLCKDIDYEFSFVKNKNREFVINRLKNKHVNYKKNGISLYEYNKTYNYENMIIDNLFKIKKLKNRKNDTSIIDNNNVKDFSFFKNKIVIFYHVCTINNYQDVFDEFIFSLKRSGLYCKIEKIYIGVVGSGFLKDIPDKAIIIYNNVDIKNYEFLTLQKLWEYCQKTNEEEYILYCHTKGVSKPLRKKSIIWRRNLLYTCVFQYMECFDKLDLHFKFCGPFLKMFNNRLLFSGNFWWAKSSFIKLLPNPDPNTEIIQKIKLHDDIRYSAETWLMNSVYYKETDYCNLNSNSYEKPLYDNELFIDKRNKILIKQSASRKG